MVTCTSPYTCLYKLILLLLLGPRQENNLKFLVWPFFNITDIFCAKTRLGHACMRPNMVPSHPILKLSPPPNKVGFSEAKQLQIPGEKLLSRVQNIRGQTVYFLFFIDLFCHSDLATLANCKRSYPTDSTTPD